MTTPPPPRRLHRRTTDRIVAGVCGGLADYTGVDVSLLRVLVVVLTVFGGAGLPLYVAAWLLVPAEGESRSVAERTFGR